MDVGKRAVVVQDLTDPVAVGDAFEVLKQDVVTLENQPFLARRVSLHLGRCLVVFQTTAVRLRSRASVREGLMAFVAWPPDARGAVDGEAVRPELLLAAAPGTEIELVVEPGYRSVSFLVRPDELKTHLERRDRDTGFRMPGGAEWRSPGRSGLAPLVELGLRLTATAADDPSLFDDDERSRAAADVEVLEALLEIQPDPVTGARSRREETRRSYAEVVEVAQSHALESLGERLYVTELCDAACVSERTLQNAFREVLGMPPMAYLRRMRLHRARKALRSSSTGETRVSDVALTFGFWHFGEFAREYRECFGETPSTTLKRSVEG